MADTKRFGALLVAAAACVGLTAVHAEQQHKDINITGEMQFDAVSRKGTTTFTAAQTLNANPSADSGSFTNQTGSTSDESSLINQKVYLNFSFDLASNAKAYVQLGMRGLAGNNYSTEGTTNPNTGTGTNGGGDSSFNARIRQAYVELHEVMVPGLGLKLGMQDVVMGLDRGDANHFVMFSPGWGKHYQIRDGGRVERSFSTRARAQNLPLAGAQTVGGTSTAANGFDDLNWGDTGSFAFVVTYDQKDMFSADLFCVCMEEDGTGYNEAHLWGVNASIPLGKMGMSEKSMLTAHFFNVKDNTFAQAPLTVAGKLGSGADFWQYGLGADVFVASNFEAYGEFAVQNGNFADHFDLVNTAMLAGVADRGQERTQDAYAFYLGGKAMIPGADAFKPSLDVSYWCFSGDDNWNDNSNRGFINYGDNKSTMIVEDNEYGIGLSNNYNVWRFKGSVDMAGLDLFKKRKTPFTVSYNVFDVQADAVRTNLVNTSAAPQGGAVGINPSALGTELDFSLAHEYSENVTFKLAYGVFRPGMYIRENTNLGGMGQNARGNTGATMPEAGDGSDVHMMMFTTAVKF